MNYTHLQYFIAAAQCEHIIRAAKQLNITQSTLSRAVSKLEDELGVALFEKTGRSVRLTDAGRLFLVYAMQAVKIIDTGVEQMKLFKNSLRGEMKINSVYAYSYKELPELLKNFLTQYPDVAYSNIECPSREIISNILSNRADIGFCSDYFDFENEYPQLEYRTVYKNKVVLVCTKGHWIGKLDTVELRDIEKEKLISFTPFSGFISLTKKLFEENQMVHSPSYFAEDDFSICWFAANGLGIALVGENIATELQRLMPNLHIAHLADTVCFQHIYMIWKKGKQLPEIAVKFIKYVEKEISINGM